MNSLIYIRHNDDISLYAQFNFCAEYAKRYGYSINSKIFDFQGNKFYEAVNKVIADNSISTLIIYSKDMVFDKNDDYLFYKIYLEKLGKKLLFCI